MKIPEKIADELDIPVELVDMVIDELWNATRYYITRPLETKKGILLNGFGKFEVSLERLHFNLKKDTPAAKSRKEFYKQLLKQLTDE